MGRTVTPKYRLEYTEKDARGRVSIHQMGWDARFNGRATFDNAVRYCEALQKSTLAGGCNEQIGPRDLLNFQLVNQKTGDTVASGVLFGGKVISLGK